MKPIVLILLGVKPILCAAFACEVSICWICFLSLVSKLTLNLAECYCSLRGGCRKAFLSYLLNICSVKMSFSMDL